MQPLLRTQRLQRLCDHLKCEARKVITTQTTQTSYFRIAYVTCSLVLLWTKLLTPASWQRNLKKTWVHENIVRESKTLLSFDLVLKFKWQNQNALPSNIWIALPFRALLVSLNMIYFNLILLALQDHCSYHSSNKLHYEPGFKSSMARSTAPPDAELVELPGTNSHINTGDSLAAQIPNLPHKTSWSARCSKTRFRRPCTWSA